MKKFSLIFFLFFSVITFAQNKTEKEERIDFKAFPEEAKSFMNLFLEFDKIKYYRETDGEKISYEAKLKHKRKLYSIEFSESGKIEDIEVTTKFKKIPKTIRANIKSYLNSTFKKHYFIKTQKQFVFNDKTNISKYVKSILNNSNSLESNYEIVIEVILKDKKTEQREFLFNKLGEFISYRVVIPLNYDHVLY